MSGQIGNLTNLETSARTGSVLMCVPFSEGDMADLATLRANRSVQIGATTYDTFWHKGGQDHEDGSIQFAYAVFRPTLDAGVATPTAPTHTPTVVTNASNSPGTASFPSWSDALNIFVSYTDDNPAAGGAVTVNVAAQARAALAGSKYVVTDEGGKRTVYYSCPVGAGTHYTGTAASPTTVLGLLQVHVWITYLDQDPYGQMTVLFSNEACYPSPSGPPDPSAADPAQSTWVPSGESLAEPLQRFIDGLEVQVAHASQDVYVRPWWVDNYSTGAGPFGTMTATDSGLPNGTTITLPIEGLAWRQGWAFKASISATSAAEAEELAERPGTYLALPTYATWTACERSVTLANGDVLTINGWGEFVIPDIDSATLSDWYQDGVTAELKMRNWRTSSSGQTTETTGWGHPKLSRDEPEGGGEHYALGQCYEGEMMFGGSIWHAYIHQAETLREYSARPMHLALDEYEATHLLNDSGGVNRGDPRQSCFMQVNNWHFSSRVQFGAGQAPSGNQGGWQPAQYNGADASRDNPDPNGANRYWRPYLFGHAGFGPALHTALVTDDPALQHLGRMYANGCVRCQPMHDYEGIGPTNPRNLQTRGEFRVLQAAWQGAILSDDATWFATIEEHSIDRATAWLDTTRNSWWRGLGAQFSTFNNFAAECGIPPMVRNQPWQNGRRWIAWQSAMVAHVVPWLMRSATADQKTTIATAIERITRDCVEESTSINPELFGSRLPETARRSLDDCFAGRAPTISDPGEYPHNDLLIPFSRQTNDTKTLAQTNRAAAQYNEYTNLLERFSARGASSFLPLYMGIRLAGAFAGNRAIAGFNERRQFILDSMEATWPELTNGKGFEWGNTSRTGFASGDYHDSTSSSGPAPSFTVSSRSGTLPFQPLLDASAATYTGAASAALFEWFADYDVASPPTTPTFSQYASAGTTWTPTYLTQGTKFPALRITQADGQTATFVDPTGIVVQASSPPVPSFTVSTRTGSPPLSPTLDGSASTYTGLAASTTLQWFDDYDPADPPDLPNSETTADDGLTYSPTYNVAGLYHPALRIIQANGETAIYVDPEGVNVEELATPPIATFTADATSGAATFSPTFDGSGSTYSSAASETVFSWFKNYDPANPPTTPDATRYAGVSESQSFDYSVAGTFYPALLITQADGQTSLFVHPGITVTASSNAPPVATFSVDTFEAERPHSPTLDAASSTFTGASSGVSLSWWKNYQADNPDGVGAADATYTWDTQTTYQPTYDEAGTFYPAVQLTQADGQSSLYISPTPIKVTEPATAGPVASFTPSDRVALLAPDVDVTLNGSASSASGSQTAASYKWWKDYDTSNPGDPDATIAPATSENYVATYTVAGTFYPALLVTDESGRTALFRDDVGIEIQSLSVADPPGITSIAVDVSAPGPGDEVVFTYTPNGPEATSWSWQYRVNGSGDQWDELSRTATAYWTLPSDLGVAYDIRLQATNEFGTTTETELALVQVKASLGEPVAAFTLTAYRLLPGEAGWPALEFSVATNTSTGADVYLWTVESIPDGGEEGELPGPWTVTGPGTFAVTLRALNFEGEADVLTKYVTVLGDTGGELRYGRGDEDSIPY